MPEKDDIPVIFSQLVIRQRDDSGHAIAAYRDTWRLLLTYASDQIGIAPARLDLTDLDAPDRRVPRALEHQRGNTVRTRNARLAAIQSLFRFAALAHSEQLATMADTSEKQ